MLCDDCGRNEAVVHITQIGPDGRIEKNLCEKCAAAYGEFVPSAKKGRTVSMDDFLKGIFSSGAERGEKRFLLRCVLFVYDMSVKVDG